jgi:hypothetical protein
MKMEGNIPILDNGNLDNRSKMCDVAINALKVMTEKLVYMENNGRNEREMMIKCVWPIIGEAARKFMQIENGEEINVSDFDRVVKK